MHQKKILSTILVAGLLLPLSNNFIHAKETEKQDVKVIASYPGLTIGKLTEPQIDTKENISKKYLKGELSGAKAQSEQISHEKDVDFQPTSIERKDTQTEVRLAQTYKNYKIYGQDMIVNIDEKGVVTTVSGKVAQNLDGQPHLKITNFLSQNTVKSSLRDVFKIPKDAIEKEFTGETVIYKKKDGSYTYAEVVTLTCESNQQVISGDAIISVVDGEILFQEKFNLKQGQKSRNQTRDLIDIPPLSPYEGKGTGKNARQESVLFNIARGEDGKFYLADLSRGNGVHIYDANYADIRNERTNYPGTLISSNTVNFDDKEAAGVMKNLGDVYDYFDKVHNFKSYDNRDAEIVASVHAFDSKTGNQDEKESYENAMWRPGWKQMLFGDGLNGTLTSALDITAHEFGHAVFTGATKNNTITKPNAETKAIDEGLADFWGSQIEMYVKKDKGNWIIGDTLDGRILRDIPEEIGDWGQKLYTNLQEFYNDNNDKEPHINSGIISHVLYQLTEGTTYNKISVKKQGNDKVSKIVMRALQNYVTAGEDFESLHSHIVQAARDLYGNATSAEVEKAFQAHGYKSAADFPDRMVLKGESNVNSVIMGINHRFKTLKISSDALLSQIYNDFPEIYFSVTLFDSENYNSEGIMDEKESVFVKGTDTPEEIVQKFNNISFQYGDILRIEHRDPSHTLVYDEEKEVSISKKEIRYFKLTPEGFEEILLAVPKINEATDQDTMITGTGEPGLKVTVVVDGREIGNVQVNDQGNFSVGIKKQLAGKEVIVTAMDGLGNKSEPAKIIIKDTIAPETPKVQEVTDQDTRITGTGEKGATVKVFVDGKEVGMGAVDPDGKFTVSIPKQLGGKEIVVTLTDSSGNESRPTKLTVKESTVIQDRIIEEAKQLIDQLFTDSIQAYYSHDFKTVRKGAIQVNVTQQHITEAERKVHDISDTAKEKAQFQQDIERVKQLLKERETKQEGNLVQNGLFDSRLDNWRSWMGSGVMAPTVQADGGKSKNVSKINPNSSVEQILTGLEPNTTYELSMYAKTEDKEKFSIGTKNTGTVNVSVPIYSKEYSQAYLRFKTGPHSTTATVYVYKSGGKKFGYADVVIAKKVLDEQSIAKVQ
ncbi:TPA: Ig-like domain-containing protein [Bacillus cereus]